MEACRKNTQAMLDQAIKNLAGCADHLKLNREQTVAALRKEVLAYEVTDASSSNADGGSPPQEIEPSKTSNGPTRGGGSVKPTHRGGKQCRLPTYLSIVMLDCVQRTESR